MRLNLHLWLTLRICPVVKPSQRRLVGWNAGRWWNEHDLEKSDTWFQMTKTIPKCRDRITTAPMYMKECGVSTSSQCHVSIDFCSKHLRTLVSAELQLAETHSNFLAGEGSATDHLGLAPPLNM
jgi:hypothetical protein